MIDRSVLRSLDESRILGKNFALFLILLSAAFALISARPSPAQQLYGAIRGVVKDQSGAAVPEARVTVTNVETGISQRIPSGLGGDFEFTHLTVPGVYNVTVEKTGFTKFATTRIQLNVNQTYVVPVALQVGSVTQQVTVEATPAQIQTTSMQLGATVSGQQIVNLPLNGRNFTQLQQLQPGVDSATDRFGSGMGGTNFSTNGAETQQNAFLVNGADSMDTSLNMAAIIPSPDAIGEFRLITSTINPEYSRNSGAIMNVIIKNGSNNFHGDAFDFYRETSLDARNFFQTTVSPFHQNQFGATLGGPIKRDHAFFFFSYQGERTAQPQAFAVPTVFSPAERAGNFSADTSGAFPVDNPSTGVEAVSPFPMVGENGSTYPAGTPYATLFPTGQIPTADLNPLAVKLMNQFVPLPNTTANGYTFNPTQTLSDDQYIYRVDENIRPQDSVWVYGLWESEPFSDTLPFDGASLPGFPDTNLQHFQEYTGSWTHTVSPTALNEARFSYFRFNYDAAVPVNPINPSSYGFTGIVPQTNTDVSLPVMSLNGLFTIGFSEGAPQPRIVQTYEALDNFTKVAGAHTIKAGFTMERFEDFNPYYNDLGGDYTYNGAGAFSTGFPGTDFLLGIPDSYAQGSGTIINARARDYYSYAQDQWKARRNLTLTYGLGWDIETPYEDLWADGEVLAAFRQGQQSTVFPTAPVGYVYPGDTGINKYGGPTVPYKNFAPRLGFAWSPGSSLKWSVRGGFGLYYNRTEGELVLQGLTNPPTALDSIGVGSIGGSPDFATPFTGTCAGPVPCST
ncbi:MAG TPA: carboxypeptidase-like regulatory domain-containing protein, partial [Terriglobia bacterium]|nr:carboxypeptidase-like regulatory domain-containing protein [Terriglobia bacterium]